MASRRCCFDLGFIIDLCRFPQIYTKALLLYVIIHVILDFWAHQVLFSILHLSTLQTTFSFRLFLLEICLHPINIWNSCFSSSLFVLMALYKFHHVNVSVLKTRDICLFLVSFETNTILKLARTLLILPI